MKKAVIAIVLLGVVGGGIGIYLWNKPTTDASRQKTEAVTTAVEIMNLYSSDEEAANAMYLGKVVEVTGVVQNIETNDDGTKVVSLDGGSMLGAVVCNMSEKSSNDLILDIGESATIKGTCSGYLMDVILERSVVKPN